MYTKKLIMSSKSQSCNTQHKGSCLPSFENHYSERERERKRERERGNMNQGFPGFPLFLAIMYHQETHSSTSHPSPENKPLPHTHTHIHTFIHDTLASHAYLHVHAPQYMCLYMVYTCYTSVRTCRYTC